MAQRVATIYKQIKLQLSPNQLKSFFNVFDHDHGPTQFRVYENGDNELLLSDHGNEIPLVFHPLGPLFIFEGSFVMKDIKLANTMRKAVELGKGHAVVHRLYNNHIMEYHYKNGKVTKIQEIRGEHVRLVYEYKDTIGYLNRLFAQHGVEDQIQWIKLQIDLLLDLRLKTNTPHPIDQQLQTLVKELYLSEAY